LTVLVPISTNSVRFRAAWVSNATTAASFFRHQKMKGHGTKFHRHLFALVDLF
jgi:hypothetical protein